MRLISRYFVALLLCPAWYVSCSGELPEHEPTPYQLQAPQGFPPLNVPFDNPLTVEGVALGRKLFYDPILSADFTMSCASCHAPAFGFTDNGKQFSTGVTGQEGHRNSMALINLMWSSKFFWDARSGTLADQVLHPVQDPVEMNLPWTNAIVRINAHAEYPALFRKAFGTDVVDSGLVAKALTQFILTMVSGNSRVDRFLRAEISLTESEMRGYELFRTEKADCFHCHPIDGNVLTTDNSMRNNGLDIDADMTDPGFMLVTGNPADKGKFKVPTLRNIALTGPYMHDGRFATLEDVIDHYDMGGHSSSTIDPLMKFVNTGLNLSAQEKEDLLNFLKALTDADFINNPAFSAP